MRERAWKRPPAVRLRVPDDAVITVRDRFQGDFTQDVARSVGDFVLRRGDGVYSYQLAVVLDDLAMRIGEVARAVDLLDSAPRQMLLARLLGGTPPSFAHLPLILAHDGERLAKRAHGRARSATVATRNRVLRRPSRSWRACSGWSMPA